MTTLAANGWAAPLMLAVGLGLGWIYFRMLRGTATLLVSGRGILMVLALTMGRLGLLAGVLYAAVRLGALPLLATASGMLIARQSALRSGAGGRA